MKFNPCHLFNRKNGVYNSQHILQIISLSAYFETNASYYKRLVGRRLRSIWKEN